MSTDKSLVRKRLAQSVLRNKPFFFHFFSFRQRIIPVQCLTVILIFLGMQASGVNYYSKSSGDVNTLGTWGLNTDGSGTAPSNFTGAGDIFFIRNGSSLTQSANWSVTGNVTIQTGGTFTSSGALTFTVGTLTVDGLFVRGSTGTLTPTTMTVSAGATYRHAVNNMALPTATWASTSTCEVTGVAGNALTGTNQTFGNLTWNCASQSANLNLATIAGIAGNFTIASTNGNELRQNFTPLNVTGNFIITGGTYVLASGSARTINVAGSFVQSGGTFNMSRSNGSVGTFNLYGNFTLTAGTITESANSNGQIIFDSTITQTYSAQAFNSAISNDIQFIVNPGAILQMGTGTSRDTMEGNIFTLSAGATLGITSPAGVTTTGTTGNIQVASTRTYTAGSHFVYNGNTNQNAGNGLTSANKANLTINNPGNTVTLDANTTISGALMVTAGSTLALSTFNLGSPTSTTLYCGASSGSTISGSGTLTLGGDVTVKDTATGTSGATISCPIALGSTRQFNVEEDSTTAVDLLVSGLVSGSTISLFKLGAGTMELSNSGSTYSGLTRVDAGKLRASGAGSVVASSNGPFGNNSGSLNLNGGTIESNVGTFSRPISITATNSGLDAYGANRTISSTITQTTPGTFNLNIGATFVSSAEGQTLTLSGVISNFSGTLGLSKVGNSVVTLSNNNTFGGGVSLTAGTLNINHASALGDGGTLTISGASTILNNTSGASITLAPSNPNPLALNADFTFTGTDDLNLGTGIITLNADRQITSSTAAKTLTLGGVLNNSSRSITKAGNGNLSFGATAKTILNLTINAGTLISTSDTLNLSGNFTNNGTFTHNSGTVRFNGTTAQSIQSGGSSFHNFMNSNTGASCSVNTSNLSVANNFVTLSGSVLDMTTFSLTVNTVSHAGQLRTQSTANPPITTGKTWGGIVNFDRSAGGQFISGGTYNTLTLSNNSGEQTSVGNIVASTLNHNSNVADSLNMATFTLSATTLNNTGTIRTQNTDANPLPSGLTIGGAVIYDASTGSQSIVSNTYGFLTMGNISGTQTAIGNLTANTLNNNKNAAIILNMASFALSATTINNAGNIRTQNTSALPIPSGLTYGGTIEFNRTNGGQTIPGANYNTLSLTNASGVQLASGNINVNTFNHQTSSLDTFDLKTNTLAVMNLNNTGTIQTQYVGAGAFSSGLTIGGVVEFNRSNGGQIVPSNTYNYLVISNTSDTQTAGGDLVVDTLRIYSNAALKMVEYSLSGLTNVTVDGVLITRKSTSTPFPGGLTWGGTVILDATSGITLPATASKFNNLRITGGGTVTTAANDTITGLLSFVKGIINTDDSRKLILTESATTSGASDSSFVDGPVQKSGNTAFVFPVGKVGTGYQAIGIGAASGSNVFTAKYIRSSPKMDYDSAVLNPLTKVSNCEYWDLSRSSGSSAVDVSIYGSYNSGCGEFDSSSYFNGIGSNVNSLRVAHWNADSAKWENATTGTTVVSGTAPFVVVTAPGVNSFSPFTFGTVDVNPLPVELVKFEAVRTGADVILNWSTASELNNDYFQIERSIDGRHFEIIGRVNGNGSTQQLHTYQFMDIQALTVANVLYYRLKQVDFNGEFEYSPIVYVSQTGSIKLNEIKVFPNPCRDHVNLNFNLPEAQEIQVNITDMQGRIVLEKVFLAGNGAQSISLGMQDLAPGVYGYSLSAKNIRLGIGKLVKR